MLADCLNLNSKALYQSSKKEKESCCFLFPSLTKRGIRHFHVVVVQRRVGNVQKSVMHVQSCRFANQTYCFLAVHVAVAVVVALAPHYLFERVDPFSSYGHTTLLRLTEAWFRRRTFQVPNLIE